MKTTATCPVCKAVFERRHSKGKTPIYCSRECANRAPGRMTLEIRKKISRPSPRNKGGTVVRGRTGRPYVQVYVRLEDRHRHFTISKRGFILRSHLVWDRAHPDDPVMPGEIIHHKDNDSLNDTLENLEKLPSQREHARHHFSQPRRPLTEEHKRKLSEVKRARMGDVKAKPCENCGTLLLRERTLAGGRFCSQACHYRFRKGKGRTGW